MSFFRRSKRPSESTLSRANVVAFLNQKGGVGKTTMAFNTAHALSKKGRQVLMIDMDPQANLTHLFGKDYSDKPHLFQLLINSIRELKSLHTPCLLDDVMIHDESGVDLIPCSQDLSGFELTVAGISSPRQLILKRFLELYNLTSSYDDIIIDGPPTLGLLVVNILCASSGVMVPFKPDEFSRKGLEHFYRLLGDIEEMGVSKVPQVLAHIPNLVDLRRKHEAGELKRISHELNLEFGEGSVCSPFYNKVPLVRSQADKKSVFDFQSKDFTLLQEQFSSLADRIVQG